MERTAWQDALKCFLIFSVIIFHVDSCIVHIPKLSGFIITYFLSTFFFISGINASHSRKIKEMSFKSFCYLNVKRLVLPMCSAMLLLALFRMFLPNGNFDAANLYLWLFDSSKGGGWFVFSLFEFLVLHKIVVKYDLKIQLAFTFLVWCLVVCLNAVLPSSLCGLFSLMAFRRYWLLYMLGYFSSRFLFKSKMKWLNTFLVVAYVPLCIYYTLCINDIVSVKDFGVWMLTNICGCVFWIYIFSKIKHINTSICLWGGKQWIYICCIILFFMPCQAIKDGIILILQ